jgi:uncharacterized protein YjbI with pentapeptide repeats
VTSDPGPARYKILSTRTIWWAAAIIVLTGVGATVWLLLAYGGQLEAIKTASTIFLGTGGAGALLLAARRQRSTEIALNQKDRDLHHQEADAVERRITDLYTKAADQLGSDKAPVRLAGLYALERVAQNNPAQRPTIVNVLCAYLRMPYQLPGDQPPDNAEDKIIAAHRERIQEREVRLTAQRLLADHLRPGDDPKNPVPTFWANTDLDLTGATLIDFNLTQCTVHAASFQSATFAGVAYFEHATFTGDAGFFLAKFTRPAAFESVVFNGSAGFALGSFAEDADFSSAHFVGGASFTMATFGRHTKFVNATFDGSANFGRGLIEEEVVTFNGPVQFGGAAFKDSAYFTSAVFKRDANFGSEFGLGEAAKFDRTAGFQGVVFNETANFGSVNFNGDADFRNAAFKGGANFARDRGFKKPPTSFAGKVDFASASFANGVPSEVSKYWSPPEEGG